MNAMKKLMTLNLRLFDTAANVTTSSGAGNDLTPEMKTYYSDFLIDNATPNLIHDQFGQRQPIPKGGGKNIEFRKYSPLSKATTPLAEGVTPTGQALDVSAVNAQVEQYGGWIQLPDMLLLTAVDNNMVQATELLGDQAGRTLDTITREVLSGGTNVLYAPVVSGGNTTDVTARSSLTKDAKLTVDCVLRAVRFLKTQLAKQIDGSYVAIIHPDVSYDLQRSDEWREWQKYTTSENLFNGEIGKIGGVRFVESTEAKIFHAADLLTAQRNMTVSSVNAKVFTVAEAVSAAEAAALVGRKLLIKGVSYTVASAVSGTAGAATVTVTETVTGSPAAAEVIYPGEAGAAGIDVYSTLVFGANAYGVTEVAGGGLEHIVKQLGSSGTADPLNQRASAGWKATRVAERLVEGYMLRIESASTFDSGAN